MRVTNTPDRKQRSCVAIPPPSLLLVGVGNTLVDQVSGSAGSQAVGRAAPWIFSASGGEFADSLVDPSSVVT